MCVIIIKPAGVSMPTLKELGAAGKCHPDGFGFVTPERYYRTMNYSAFVSELRQVPKDSPCIIHFRFATHGSIKKANCHPFKKGDIFFAHNGILNITPDGDKTDSQTAFDSLLYPIAERYGLDSPELRSAVSAIIGSSKFAFLQGREIKAFGHFEKYHGRFYSNTRHLALLDSPKTLSWQEYLRLR